MIQPGQKLTEGDYFIPESVEQLKQIREVAKVGANWNDDSFIQTNFDNKFYPVYMQRFKMVVSNSSELPFGKTKYSFPDFKQLCINTFGYGK